MRYAFIIGGMSNAYENQGSDNNTYKIDGGAVTFRDRGRLPIDGGSFRMTDRRWLALEVCEYYSIIRSVNPAVEGDQAYVMAVRYALQSAHLSARLYWERLSDCGRSGFHSLINKLLACQSQNPA